ncbi:hypothetical protein VQL36_05445 [Chengkuizengella sp. SCS-71B]|uniref:hypothetical protein n=1 Tax=Chengkuizengella sp. SCS-71B TaxID=3115290 RepID=UPI0032C23D78
MGDITNDVLLLIENKELPKETQQLKTALNKYKETRKVDNNRDRAQLIFLIIAILDIPEDDFHKTIERIQKIITIKTTADLIDKALGDYGETDIH